VGGKGRGRGVGYVATFELDVVGYVEGFEVLLIEESVPVEMR